MKIISRDNSLLRRARAVRDGKVEKSIFVEGLRLSEEALRSGLAIEVVIYSEQIAKKDRAAQLIRELERIAGKSGTVDEKLLASISYTKTPQGIIALASRPSISEKEFKERQPAKPLLIILHGINNPVNVGASADGAGNYTETDWQRPTALIMGSESHGLSTDEISAADHVVSIPMKGSTESLNVAVAAGILLYEASRQR